MDKGLLLKGCLDSKAENEIWCLKTIIIVLDIIKDLGHPALIYKQSFLARRSIGGSGVIEKEL